MIDPKALLAAREWLELAAGDLRSAGALLDLDPPEVRTAAFHCQQAAEKYLKAFLVARGEEPPKIHALEPLLERAESYDRSLRELRVVVPPLGVFAVEARYPRARVLPTPEDVRDALARAHRVRDSIVNRLPSANTPDA